MIFDFWIDGELPSLNEYIAVERSNRYAAAKLKKDTEDYIVTQIKAQIKKSKNKPIFIDPVTVYYFWTVKNKKKDRDNIAFAKKFVQDALVKAGVIKSDGWQYVEGFRDFFKISPKAGVLVRVDDRRSFR